MSPFTVSASARTSVATTVTADDGPAMANMSVIVTLLATSQTEEVFLWYDWARPLSIGPLTDQSDYYKYIYFKKSIAVNPNSTSAQV